MYLRHTTHTHPLEWRIILMDDDAPVRSLMPPPSCCLICDPASSKFVQHFSGSLKSDQFVCIKCTSTDDGLLARLDLRNARPHERNYRQTSRQPPGPHLAPHSWPSSRMLYTYIPPFRSLEVAALVQLTRFTWHLPGPQGDPPTTMWNPAEAPIEGHPQRSKSRAKMLIILFLFTLLLYLPLTIINQLPTGR